jgi:hypothetical protein
MWNSWRRRRGRSEKLWYFLPVGFVWRRRLSASGTVVNLGIGRWPTTVWANFPFTDDPSAIPSDTADG